MQVDLGCKFGRLTVISSEIRKKSPRGWASIYFRCRCECGTEKDVSKYSITSGRSTSCGCLASEMVSARSIKHGKRGDPIYAVWNMMMQRCHTPTSKSFKEWRGRGISVCDRWHTFTNFYEDVGDPPFKGASLDRIDNNGNYEPSNVRWADRKQQNRNKRNNVRFEFDGKSLTLPEWSEIVGIGLRTLVSRVYLYGWSIEKALTTPVKGVIDGFR